MNWWPDILDVPKISNEWAPAFGAAAGASGAIAAQIVSAIAAGRREEKAAAERLADGRILAFRDDRKTLFKSTLILLDKQQLVYRDFLAGLDSGQVSYSLPTGKMLEDEWDELTHEFNLIAPNLVLWMNKVQRGYFQLEASLMTADLDAAAENLKEIQKLKTSMVRQMREDLGIPNPKFESEQTAEPKKSKSKKKSRAIERE